MALPHLRFVWTPGRQEGNWKLGIFSPLSRGSGLPVLLTISVRGLLLWGLGFAFAAYLAGAGALLSWLNRKPYNFITFSDLVLPTRWPQLESLRGEADIREGLDDLRDKKWSAALMKIQAGLSRDPNTTKGRLELAALMLALNDRRHAEEVLREGLKPTYPGRGYVGEVCRLAAQGENYDLWLYACDTALAELNGQPQLVPEHQWVIRQKLSALLAAGRNEEAVRLADAEGETESDVMREFKVLALLKAGQTDAAVDFLADWRSHATGPDELEQVRRLQVRTFREAGRPDDMNRTLDELRASAPASPAPYAYAIIQRLMAGRRAEADAGLKEFLDRFSGKVANLNLLADPLAEVADEPMLGRLLDTARSEGFSLLAIQRALVVAAMKNGHWTAAAGLLSEMKPALPRNDPSAGLWMELMSRTVTAALDPDDGSQDALVTFLSGRHLQLRLYRDAVDGLRQANRLATARRVMTLALGVFPDNAALKESAASLDVAIAQRPKAAEPGPGSTIPLSPEGETKFFATLDAAIESGNDEAALNQLHTARASRPPWLDKHDAEMRRDEILLDARQRDSTAMVAAANLFLDGSDNRSLAVLNLAQQFHAGDTVHESLLLLQAIVRKNPAYAPAVRLLPAWAPPATPAPPNPVVTPVVTANQPTVPPSSVVSKEAGEADFFQALAATMQTGDTSSALSQIRAIRNARPIWLDAHDQELRGDEILLTARGHDDVSLVAGLRLYLNGSTARSQSALELAKQLHTGDTVYESLQVVQEVLRKTPGFPPATRLLAGWQSVPPTK